MSERMNNDEYVPMSEEQQAIRAVTIALRMSLKDQREKRYAWREEDTFSRELWEDAKTKYPQYADIAESIRQVNLRGKELIVNEWQDNPDDPWMREPEAYTPFITATDRDAKHFLGNLLLVRIYNPNGSEDDRRWGWELRVGNEASTMKREEMGLVMQIDWRGVVLNDVIEKIFSGDLKLSSPSSQKDTAPIPDYK